jgi:hypothetical protein
MIDFHGGFVSCLVARKTCPEKEMDNEGIYIVIEWIEPDLEKQACVGLKEVVAMNHIFEGSTIVVLIICSC